VTASHRRFAVTEGQLTAEFRSRVQSGFQSDTNRQLNELIADIGPPCWLHGPTAGALHPFDGIRLVSPFHVLTLRDRNVRRIGVVMHTTDRLDLIDRATVNGLPVTSPARTLIDLAPMTPTAAMTAALDGALRDGLVSESFLHGRISALRGRGRHGIPTLLEIIEGREITRGAHSWLERELLRLVAAAGLPRPEPQQVLGKRGTRLIRVDFRFPGTRLVVEVLGYRWHRTGAQMQVDAERLNRLLLDGYLVLQFTYSDLVERPREVVHRIVEALSVEAA
jgi:very-short-patch-repair endonuclease